MRKLQSAQSLVNALMRSEVLAKHLLLCHYCGKRFPAGEGMDGHLSSCKDATLDLLRQHALPAARLAATPECDLPSEPSADLSHSQNAADKVSEDVARYNKAAVRCFLRGLLSVDDRRVCIHALGAPADGGLASR